MDMREENGRCVVDFDQHSAEYAAHFGEISNEMRERCPVAYTEAHGGYWVVSTYDAVAAAARDSVTFSSWKDLPLGSGPLKGPVLPDHNPIREGFAEMDGPEHLALRQPLAPFFSPRAVEAMLPDIRMAVTWVIDQFIEEGSANLVADLASPAPPLLAMRMLGLPLTEWRQFQQGADNNFQAKPDPDLLAAHQKWMRDQLTSVAQERRVEPKDDIISFVANMKPYGELLPMDEIFGILQLLLVGGVGTTAHLLSSTMKHLSDHPRDKEWLLEDLSRLPNACEEMLRYYPPVVGLARTVTEPCVVEGQPIEKYDRVWLSWAAANRDPKAFDDPETVSLDRFPNRHQSFGVGVHRCIGSNVARAVWLAVMEQVLTRLPDYQIDNDAAVYRDSIGFFNGWTSLPATFTPGERVGGELPWLS